MKTSITALLTIVWFWFTVVSASPILQTSDLIEARLNRLRGRQSDLQFSDDPADWPSTAQLEGALTTGPGKAFFWTGRVGGVSMEGKALQLSRAAGGTTLEGGLAAAGFKMPGFDTRNAASTAKWEEASAILANKASGTAFVVMGTSLRPGNVFDTAELPALKRNRRVTQVVKIDGLTGKRTVIFDRNAKKTDQAAQEAAARNGACGTPPPSPTTPGKPPLAKLDISGAAVERRQAGGPAARGRKKTGKAPACPLPGAAQKKVVPRSATKPKPPPARSYPKNKPAAKPPAPKRKTARPPNRPKRAKGTPAPPRKRTTPVKKPKVVPKPPAKNRGAPRRRRR